MKYAYIAMVVIYLITFGCNPDKAEKTTESHGSATPATVEQPHQEEAPAVVHQQEQVEQDHAEQQKAADTELKEVAAAEHKAATVEGVEQPTTEELAPENQWEVIAKSAGVTVAALMNEGAQPTEKKAAEKGVAKKQAVEEKQAVKVADSEQVVMPCGKMMAKKDIPAGAPCATMQSQAPADLNVAMQKIVEATNQMVMVTRQLVIATQEMLNASKEAAVETTGTDKK